VSWTNANFDGFARLHSLESNRWHLDEMVVRIGGKRMYLWRAVDHYRRRPAATRPINECGRLPHTCRSRHLSGSDDDAATARQIEACLTIIRQQTETAGGRFVNVAGDGILLLFTSAVSAVTCAITFQRSIAALNRRLPPARRMEFRVGINSGDILITPAGAMHGDAINVAARIQGLAPPGGILVTGVVHDQLQGHGLVFEYVRTSALKNLSRQVRSYRVDF
jgi:class 3 adenylate cyclase